LTHSPEFDLRPGGTRRCVLTASGGFEVAFHGDYREIIPDQRMPRRLRRDLRRLRRVCRRGPGGGRDARPAGRVV
jgi:hypothetical protein